MYWGLHPLLPRCEHWQLLLCHQEVDPSTTATITIDVLPLLLLKSLSSHTTLPVMSILLQMASYLGAYYGDALPEKAIEILAYGEGVEAARQALESAWKQVGFCIDRPK